MKPSTPRLLSQSQWICRSCRVQLSTPRPRPFSTSSPSRTPAPVPRRLPLSPARTRFAPSPTGNLHLGSLRTALFNYLLAKRTGGQFLLRIEDTDQKRTIEGAEAKLQDDLKWAGLQWDEGPGVGGPYGPYRQSERISIYKPHIDRLLETGHAYRCFCSAERIETWSKARAAEGLPAGYDRTCTHISQSESDTRAAEGQRHVVRIRAPDTGYPPHNDLVHHKVRRQSFEKISGYDDPVIIKSDGHPTYHFANVVDDHLMQITHVIRGAEWVDSTPLHLGLYKAFGWAPPLFAHVALLQNEERKKLSKRDDAADIRSFDRQGIFPEALLNFAALLGWSHSKGNDVFSLDELIDTFGLKFTRGNTTVSYEKLWFLQKAHAHRYITTAHPLFSTMIAQITTLVEAQVPPAQLRAVLGPRPLSIYIRSIFAANGDKDNKNYTTPSAFVASYAPFLAPLPPLPTPYVSPRPEIPLSALRTFAAALCLVPDTHWTAETHRANMASHAALSGPFTPTSTPSNSPLSDHAKLSQKAWNQASHHYLRWALTGGLPGPSTASTMGVLGREVCVRRIQDANRLVLAQEAAEIRPLRIESFGVGGGS